MTPLSLCVLSASLSLGQAFSPPGDGEIRVLYWELRNETEVWLTLELAASEQKPPPPQITLTLSLNFPGKRPKVPPEGVEMRAYAGFFFPPRVELRLVLDEDEKIDLVPPGVSALASGILSDYLSVPVPLATLGRMARATRVRGNALGREFELTGSQRKAVGLFLDRVLSENPGQSSSPR